MRSRRAFDTELDAWLWLSEVSEKGHEAAVESPPSVAMVA